MWQNDEWMASCEPLVLMQFLQKEPEAFIIKTQNATICSAWLTDRSSKLMACSLNSVRFTLTELA